MATDNPCRHHVSWRVDIRLKALVSHDTFIAVSTDQRDVHDEYRAKAIAWCSKCGSLKMPQWPGGHKWLKVGMYNGK